MPRGPRINTRKIHLRHLNREKKSLEIGQILSILKLTMIFMATRDKASVSMIMVGRKKAYQMQLRPS